MKRGRKKQRADFSLMHLLMSLAKTEMADNPKAVL